MHGLIARLIYSPPVVKARSWFGNMKSFLAACGIEDSFQFAVENQDATESRLRLLYQPFAVIGRDLRADVVLDHADVSRRHVYLQAIEGRVFWIDLESRTGTRNESESQRFGWLEGGRTLSVGPYVIRRFVGDSQSVEKRHRSDLPRNTPLVARPSAHATQSEVALEFLNGPSQLMLKPAHRILSLIGSASGCKFRLTDSSVSRFHGSLLQTPAGLWIVDLLGQKGITVNDVPVRCSRLVDGDIVRIGRYQIRIRCRPRVQESAKGLLDLGHVAFVPKAARQSRTPLSLNSFGWSPITTPVSSEAAVNGQELPALSIETSPISSNVDLVPSHSMLLGSSRQSEPTESLLVPLVNQFGMMQQQMFDQFQQAMAMMVKMFGTMHRDQMEVIRAELDRLHELTDEFHALKNEFAERTREKPQLKPRESEFSSASVDRSVALEPSNPATQPLSADPRGGARAHQVSRALGPSPKHSATRTTGQQPSLDDDIPSSQPASTSSGATSNSDPISKSYSHSPSKPGAAGRNPNSDRDTVLWLHNRIMILQRERESRWQKILKLMPGMSSS
jgi:pSer/pThr/pTyr-binding forkhead associated (FHA) protein